MNGRGAHSIYACEAEGVRYAYNGLAVLEDFSLRIHTGRVTGILGPNGAGKTTLIRLLSGAERPSRGIVRVMGADVRGIPHKRLARMVSVVPQRSHIDFDFTVRDIVMMGRYPHERRMGGESEDPAPIADEALRLTGLEELAGRSVARLSGGEYQRVLIARALCQSAPVMLLDEPVSNLDIRHQLEVLHLVRRMTRERGMTAVCVLHDLNMAARFCDDIALLDGGELRAAGTPGEVLTDALMRRVYGVGMRRVDDGAGGWTLVPMDESHAPVDMKRLPI